MQHWQTIDEAGRVRRADYHFSDYGVATCTAVDLGGGRLLLFSPPGGAEAAPLFAELDEQGEVVAAVAPNGFHRMGLPLVAARYPQARLYAPEGAIKRTQKVVSQPIRPLQELVSTLPPEVEVFVPPHMRWPDTMVRVHSASGVILTIHDIVLNIQQVSSNPVERWVMGLLGYQVGLRVNWFGCLGMVADKKALGAWLAAELQRVPPSVFVPGHGPLIDDPSSLAQLPELALRI